MGGLLNTPAESATPFLQPYMARYHGLQLGEFLSAVTEGQDPSVNGEARRAVVELFTAIYQSQRDGKPIQFPLRPGVFRLSVSEGLRVGLVPG
jgi:hypothetical protein